METSFSSIKPNRDPTSLFISISKSVSISISQCVSKVFLSKEDGRNQLADPCVHAVLQDGGDGENKNLLVTNSLHGMVVTLS